MNNTRTEATRPSRWRVGLTSWPSGAGACLCSRHFIFPSLGAAGASCRGASAGFSSADLGRSKSLLRLSGWPPAQAGMMASMHPASKTTTIRDMGILPQEKKRAVRMRIRERLVCLFSESEKQSNYLGFSVVSFLMVVVEVLDLASLQPRTTTKANRHAIARSFFTVNPSFAQVKTKQNTEDTPLIPRKSHCRRHDRNHAPMNQGLLGFIFIFGSVTLGLVMLSLGLFGSSLAFHRAFLSTGRGCIHGCGWR